MRLLASLAVLAAVTGMAPDASAKEGVRARLLQPVPREAEPGSTLRIAWALEDAQGRPFGAGEAFVRVADAGGASAEAEAQGHGHFVADVVVPAGGIERVEFGLRGRRRVQGGTWERADAVFALRGAAFAPPPPAPGPAWLPLGLGVVAAGGVLLAVWRLRRGTAAGRSRRGAR